VESEIDKIVLVISPMDVAPFISGHNQVISPQSQANADAALRYYYTSATSYQHTTRFIVLGGNGDIGGDIGYINQKLGRGVHLLGKTESTLIQAYLLKSGVPESSIIIEQTPSHNTIENAQEVLAILCKIFKRSGHRKILIRYFASTFINELNIANHAPRVDATFRTVLRNSDLSEDIKSQILGELRVIGVPTKIGNENTNTQSTLQNPFEWLLLNVGSLIVTRIRLGKLERGELYNYPHTLFF
jgi:hypothetical protein